MGVAGVMHLEVFAGGRAAGGGGVGGGRAAKLALWLVWRDLLTRGTFRSPPQLGRQEFVAADVAIKKASAQLGCPAISYRSHISSSWRSLSGADQQELENVTNLKVQPLSTTDQTTPRSLYSHGGLVNCNAPRRALRRSSNGREAKQKGSPGVY